MHLDLSFAAVQSLWKEREWCNWQVICSRYKRFNHSLENKTKTDSGAIERICISYHSSHSSISITLIDLVWSEKLKVGQPGKGGMPWKEMLSRKSLLLSYFTRVAVSCSYPMPTPQILSSKSRKKTICNCDSPVHCMILQILFSVNIHFAASSNKIKLQGFFSLPKLQVL